MNRGPKVDSCGIPEKVEKKINKVYTYFLFFGGKVI